MESRNIVLLDHDFPASCPELGKFDIKTESKPEDRKVKGFDILKMKQWITEEHIKHRISANGVLEYLRRNDMLANCVGLAELGGIYKKGPDFFEKNFGFGVIFAWNSIIDTPNGPQVPYLVNFGDSMALWFHRLESRANECCITLLHTKGSRIYDSLREDGTDNTVVYPDFTKKKRL
ncbi:MAG: hypothetical protein WCT49_01315 [Candidatus Paceibacterota bacterium]|jgi:hypothetical protein